MGVLYNLPSPRQVTDAGCHQPPLPPPLPFPPPLFLLGQPGQEPTTPPPQSYPFPQETII